jgi:hypothetical protein
MPHNAKNCVLCVNSHLADTVAEEQRENATLDFHTKAIGV